MTTTTFVPGTIIESSWLNDVNDFVYNGAQPTDFGLVNVKHAPYSAVGDGVADDTAAINAAIATGLSIELPAGTYLVTSALTALTSAQEIRGHGQDASVIKVSGNGYDVITLAGRAGVRDLQITTSTATARASGAHINIVGGNNAFVINCVLLYAYETIIFTSGIVSFLQNIQMRDFAYGGIRIDAGFDIYLNNITADNVGAQPSYGLKVITVGGLHVTSCDFIHCGTGIVIQPTAGDTIQWLFFDRVQADTCSNEGWLIDGTAAASVIQGCVFTGCWSASNTLNGVNIAGTGGTIDGLEFIGFRAITNGRHGLINQSSTSKNLKIIGGTFTNNSITTPATYNGIEIGVDVTTFSIIGTKCGGAFGLGGSQGCGIKVEPGTSTVYNITDNDVSSGNVTSLSDGGTGTAKVITGNLGYNPGAISAITVTASPFTYTNNFGTTQIGYIYNGTLSSVTVGGLAVATGVTNPIIVTLPQGQAVVITYSVAPTLTVVGT
jgi:hypothetical protein